MEKENLQLNMPTEQRQEDWLETNRVSKEAMAQFRALFRSSLEKLKEYGVSQKMLDPDTPLEQVRQKLIERIGEKLSERKEERRAKTEISEEEHRKLGDRRQAS